MGITERREREREEVRRKILDAARELFATEGYDRVTMRRIAEAIEYSPTTIYLHFEDKEDLVRALCHADFGRLLEAMETVGRPEDPVEAIRWLGRAYCSFALEHPNQYRFMFMTPVGRDERPPEGGNPGSLSFVHLLDAVRGAIAAGRFRPIEPLTAAQVLWMSVHGVAAALITLPAAHWPHGPASPDLVDQVVDNALRGLLAGPAEA
ncbi:MAG TPA: TetR/AcrR family transcriptional regulator [Vicinamibacteria bacterium]|nr:TetR/AcrR family transcriptional regulator [Vicinamibacteria bacterium]